MEKSVVRITSKQGCLGTGFVIDKNHDGVFVATSGHVIKNCGKSILVEDLDVDIIANHYDNGLDLGILFVKGLELEPLPVSDNAPSNSVKVIGYSKLRDYAKKESIFGIQVKQDIELAKTKKITTLKLTPEEPITKGYSGSPVICERSNNVVGIVIIQAGENANYAISTKHLLEIHNFNASQFKPFARSNTKVGLSTNLEEEAYNFIKRDFESQFEKSLQSYSGLPKVWIKPRIHTKEEDSNTITDNDTKVNIEDIIARPSSLIIKARQQYGLSCLSRYFVKEAWTAKPHAYWLYLDASQLKPHTQEIEKIVQAKLDEIQLTFKDIECVVVDEFSSTIKDANKIFNKLCTYFQNKPLIVMMTIVDNPMVNETIELPKDRNFDILHLWALPRHDIREVISKYNDEKYIGDETQVLNKVVSDLEVLNIPRTVLNCLTILKISEAGFDDSPVNRTDMLWRVLSLLFNVEDIPRYKTKPDLKDTEYILGYFCELMIKENNYYFTREKFLQELNQFCIDREIDLDVDIIFDVLYKNNILLAVGHNFRFKFSYWIFYFAAQRMHQNQDFADYILQNMNYVSYPELIEFYTGIDRRRNDALKILMEDIKETRTTVEKKCGLPDDFNIYDLGAWHPSEEKIEQMHEEVSNGVLKSSLPDTVKDQYADKLYNRTRPLNQSIYTIFEEYSLLRLMKNIQAASKALRNSDYANPEIRHDLLEEILLSWEQLSKVLLILAPILAKQGYASLEGASFILNVHDFDISEEKRFYQIIETIPTNIVGWYEHDLFTNKMKSLIYNHLENESNKLIKHSLNILIANRRPKDWNKHLEHYIESEAKNSFYLFDIYHTLVAEYKYSFASDGDLRLLEKLIKMVLAKHQLGIKKPGAKVIKKVPDSVLPERDTKLD